MSYWVLWAFCSANTVAILILGYLSWNQRRNHRHPKLEKRLSDLESEVLPILDKLESVETAAKRAYGREAQRRRRDSKPNGSDLPDPATDPDGWKREMMKRHVLGGKT